MENICFLDYLLNSTEEEVKIDYEEVAKNVNSMTDAEILQRHGYKIYYSESEKAWRTYVPAPGKKDGRRALKRANKRELLKAIALYYRTAVNSNPTKPATLKDVYEEWLLYKRDHTPVKNKTIQEYVNEWKKFYKDTSLSEMTIYEIRTCHLIRFFRELTRLRDLTYKRVSNARSVLNGIFNYAIEQELIERNPLREVNFREFVYKPVENQCENVFNSCETTKLLTYLKDIKEPYSLAIQLSFYLFIRIGETKGLRWEDIDYENRTIYLHGQVLVERELNDDLSFSPRKTVLANQMKGNTSKGFRKQYLRDEALAILKVAKELNPDGEYIFEPSGKPMTTDRFNRRLKKYCNACDITYHSSHKIRFYNASTAFTGDNLVAISKMMGHTRVETTLHYLRDVKDDSTHESVFEKLGLPSAGVQRCSKQ